MATHLLMDAGERPVWPARCVRCGAHEPRERYVLRLKRRSWIGVRRGPDVLVEAPACALCVGALRSMKFWRMFFIFGPVVAMGALGLYLAHSNMLAGRFWDRWALKIFGLAGGVPGVLFHVCRPMPIDAELERRQASRRAGAAGVFGGREKVDKVRYEFASDEYAAEFMRLNPGGRGPE